MISVVIPAHNESSVIERCLDAVLSEFDGADRPEIVVVANGCSDDTVAKAGSRAGVRVVEITEASKAAALNAGDREASGFPRIYLDADIVVPGGGVGAVAEVLTARDGILAAAPRRTLNVRGRPVPVRAYFAINQRLPVFETALFGRGMIALSKEARGRFDGFPGLIADDLFLDSLFGADEKTTVPGVEVVVEAPWTTRDLIRRLVRVRRANAAMRAAGRTGEVSATIRPADRWAWLRSVVWRHPGLAPAAVCYVVITFWAASQARLTARLGSRWERDESTRVPAAAANAAGN